jgi:hypothetical protein
MTEKQEKQAPIKIEVRRLERLETTSSNPDNS